jgi:predicted extracellular nuclease
MPYADHGTLCIFAPVPYFLIVMRYLHTSLLAFLLLTGLRQATAQAPSYQVACIGFYNLENLFDTLDGPNLDEEFLPGGAYHYTGKVYLDKLEKLAHVISGIGTDESPDGLALMGCAEVENGNVLEALVSEPELAGRHYRYVHYDSPDERGIDVGLLYNPKYFTPDFSRPVRVDLTGLSEGNRPTRDILLVRGRLNGENIYVMVNHWPSRRGGEEASAPLRAKAASVCKALTDSILKGDAGAKIVVMGDLNDDPISPSVAQVLGARGEQPLPSSLRYYNPWVDIYKDGYGTLAYNDSWNLFDQILITPAWMNKNQEGYFFQKAKIYSQPWMVEQRGRYRGYPKRTYSFSRYNGGYSDHFPTYLVLLKQTQ